MTKTAKSQRWSLRVSETSRALDLESGVFTLANPRAIAESLRRSAERSTRRKGTAFQSAMSMLNFYINRAGSRLTASRRARLDRAREELRRLYGRAPLPVCASAGPRGAGFSQRLSATGSDR